MWNFLALTFCLMVGTAGLPHILTRYYTTPSVKEARTSVAWGLFFIFLLYFTAPAYAAFARFVVYTRLVGTHIADLPRWVTLWKPAGLFDVVDKLGDGVVQLADFVIKSSDFVVLAMPEIAGLPFVITGLVMAGGLAAALSTADGLLLTIANAISHDLYYKIIDPKAPLIRAAHHHQDPPHRHRADRGERRHLPAGDHRRAGGLGLQSRRGELLPGAGDGHLVEAGESPGAVAGMMVGLAITLLYMVGSRFYGMTWWGTATVASGVFGIPLGFVTIYVVSLLTAPPPERVQELVSSVRYPKATVSSAEFAH